MIRFLLIVLGLVAWSASATPVREGLDFPNQAVPNFTDEHVLNSIHQALAGAPLKPILRVELAPTEKQLTIKVVGEKDAVTFVCELKDGTPVCRSGKAEGKILHTVEVPFGNLHPMGYKEPPVPYQMGTLEWVGVGIVGIYAAKKILNKLLTGKFGARDGHEHGLFPSEAEAEHERDEHKRALEKSVARARQNLEADLLALVIPTAQLAACGHDHSHDHDHAHEGFKCEAVTDQQVQEARKTLLRRLPGFAAGAMKDFYAEIVQPLVDVAVSVKDPQMRRHILAFFEVVTLRMLSERGTAATVTTGALMVGAQAAWETLESFVMPAGLHLFCQVGNAAILTAGTSAYMAYYCLSQPEMRQRRWNEKLQILRQLARITWRASRPNPQSGKDLQQGERLALALQLLFRFAERDLRFARANQKIGSEVARQAARELGTLKRELNGLSVELVAGEEAGPRAAAWLENLSRLYARAVTQNCEPELTAEAI